MSVWAGSTSATCNGTSPHIGMWYHAIRQVCDKTADCFIAATANADQFFWWPLLQQWSSKTHASTAVDRNIECMGTKFELFLCRPRIFPNSEFFRFDFFNWWCFVCIFRHLNSIFRVRCYRGNVMCIVFIFVLKNKVIVSCHVGTK